MEPIGRLVFGRVMESISLLGSRTLRQTADDVRESGGKRLRYFFRRGEATSLWIQLLSVSRGRRKGAWARVSDIKF